SLHPTALFSQGYASLLGPGRYAGEFATGTVSYQVFGQGQSDLIVSAGTTLQLNPPQTSLVSTASSGQSALTVTNAAGFESGQEILIWQVQGSNAGIYSFRVISDVSGNVIN